MKNRVDRNRASAARIARALDEAALRVDDETLLLRLGRLRNLALDSRTDSPSAPRTDRRTLIACRQLNQRLLDGAALWELPGVLAEIERGLFDRERRSGEESPLYEQKRRLFDRLRALASEMDALALRRRELVDAGADSRRDFDPSDALRRDEFVACGRRLTQLQAEYRRTSAALQAMVSVHLLHSEEAMLDSLERDCASLPDPVEAERRQLRLELREEALNRRTAAMLNLRGQDGAAVAASSDGVQKVASAEVASHEDGVNRRKIDLPCLQRQNGETVAAGSDGVQKDASHGDSAQAYATAEDPVKRAGTALGSATHDDGAADGRGSDPAKGPDSGRSSAPVRNIVLPPRSSSERFRTMILDSLSEKNPE